MGWNRPREFDTRSPAQSRHVKRNSPVVIRYADDLVALCHGHEAEQVKAQLAEWLAPRGLVFNEGTTQIVAPE